MKKYLALDIGGTFIKYGIFNEQYEELTSGKEATHRDSEAFLQQLIAIVKREGEANLVEGVAISIGGFINPETGSNVDPTVGYNFRAYNLKEEINRQTAYKVAVENDANCAALAEYIKGAGVGCKDLCIVTVGTGIGGAIILNGQLVRGRHFRAGEFGLMHINHQVDEGKEAFHEANATFILVKRVSDALGKQVDGKFIFANLEEPTIAAIYNKWVWELAMVVGNVAVCFDPERILIGGGVSAQERFINDLRNRVYELHGDLKQYTAITTCAFENNAGKMGAVYHFRQEYEGIK